MRRILAVYLSALALASPVGAWEKPLQRPMRGVASQQPAPRWEEGFVTGNGRMGALTYGNPGEETIIGNHALLFLPTNAPTTVPDIGKSLPELRRILKENGYGKGMAFAMEQARSQGYRGIMQTDPFHPGFELKISVPVTGTARDYLRTEDFQTGEVGVQWRDDRGIFQRKMFVSRPDNVIVVKMGCLPTGAGQPTPRLTCDLQVPPIPDARVRAFTLNNQLPADSQEAAANVLIQSQNATDKEWITLHDLYKYGGGRGYDSAIRVVVRGGTVESDGQKIHIQDADEALLLLRIEPFQTPDADSVARLKIVLARLPADYDALLTPHAKAHREIFNRVTLDLGGGADRQRTTEELLEQASAKNTLPPALLEKIYDAGRYVFICSSGIRPPNLQGIWTGTWQPAWSSDYTTNTNLQLAIASAHSANMQEPLQGFFDLVEASLPDWRMNAKNLYGARGIMAPSRESNSGKSLHWSDRFHGGLYWTAGAGWLSRFYWEHYIYTGDRKFLAEKAVPLMKEIALFYEDFLFTDESGKYRFSPSYSPENGSMDNSTMDIAVAKDVLTHLIAAADVLPAEQANVPRWKAMRDKMPPYLINAEGALQEWAIPNAPNKDNHRHMAHLYPLFESYEFDPVKTPELWRAAEVAFDARLNVWFRNSNPRDINSQSSHGRMHLSLAAARFGRGDTVWEILTKMATSRAMYPSLVTAHYEAGRTFNVDANGAIPEVINNCFVFALPGQLDLLPALPSSLPAGEIRGILARGQITIHRLHWEPGVVEVELTSDKDQMVQVRVPKASALAKFEVSGGHAQESPGSPNTRNITLKSNQRTRFRILFPK